MTAKSAVDVIGIEAIARLKEEGFVVVHSQPSSSMVRAGASIGRFHYHCPSDYWHRMVAESIRIQNKDAAK